MEQRNLILAIAVSVAILLGWQVLFEAPRIEKERAQQGAQKTEQTAQAPAGASKPGLPAAPGTAAPPSASTAGVPPAGSSAPVAGAAPRVPNLSRAAVLAQSPRVRIDTPRVNGSIRLTGGQIDDLTLAGYRQRLPKNSPNVVLLSPQGAPRPYYAQFGWIAGTPGVSVPGPDAVWTADSNTLSVGKPVTMSWTSPQGVTFRKTVSIDENYMFSVTQKVENGSGRPISVNPYGLVSMTGTPETSGFWILHEGLIGAFNDAQEEVDYDDIKDAGTITRSGRGSWIGITEKYWATALIPDRTIDTTSRFVHSLDNNIDKYQVDVLAPASTLEAGQSSQVSMKMFAGAKEVRLLDAYAEKFEIARFEWLVDWGWFHFLTKPIFYVIEYFFRLLGNFGLAILLLTVLIKLAFFPLANKSYRSMSKLKKLQPKMMEIRERYGEDRQRQNQAMMELYKKEGANPMSGCLPILIQIPVFFALYKVLFVTIEMRHAPFFGWIQDLSAPDPLGLLTAFGLVDWNVPQMLQIVNVGIWPLIMGGTMYLQQKLNPQPADPTQQKIFMLLPIVFTFMLGQFPAGLVIYWAWNNTLSIAQQWVIMRQMGVTASGESTDVAVKKAPPRGGGKKPAAEAAAASASTTAPANANKPKRKRKRR